MAEGPALGDGVTSIATFVMVGAVSWSDALIHAWRVAVSVRASIYNGTALETSEPGSKSATPETLIVVGVTDNSARDIP